VNEEGLEEFRQKLLRQKSELLALEEISREAGETVELDQAKVGRLSRMDAMQAQQMAKAAARRRKDQLRSIDLAMARIDSGDFGLCFKCGNEIDVRRLAIAPAGTRCMECVET
jgi:DnaK suppressor protein